MITVYKYELRGRFQGLDIHADGEILHVDVGYTTNFRETIFVWIKVDSFANTTRRYFEIYNTGEQMSVDEPKVYIGTVKFPSGVIQHIFELKTTKYEIDR